MRSQVLNRAERVALATLLILAVLIVVACATTTLGKAVQASDLQKRIVEESAVEFIKLKLTGDPRITDQVYASAKASYEKWASAQSAQAAALATWQTVKSATNEDRLKTALETTKKDADVYLTLVSRFVNLDAVKKKVGG